MIVYLYVCIHMCMYVLMLSMDVFSYASCLLLYYFANMA